MDPSDRADHLARRKRQEYLRAIGAAGSTSAAPTQGRIRRLHDDLGIPFTVISRRSGVEVETIKMHYRGHNKAGQPLRKLRLKTERAVLAARFSPEDGIFFPSVGIRRRFQALQAIGFSIVTLEEMTGENRKNIHAIATGKRCPQYTSRDNARRYIAAYEKLENADPADYGARRCSVARTKSVAARHGWAPPFCWDPDTIDDPQAIPEWTGACGSVEGFRIHQREGIPVCPACDAAEGAVSRPTILRNLKKYREARGLSQLGLSRILGVHASAIYYWENGRSAPAKPGVLDALVAALDVELEDLIGDVQRLP